MQRFGHRRYQAARLEGLADSNWCRRAIRRLRNMTVPARGSEGISMSTETAFLGLLLSGLTALLAGVGLTRLYWRPDIPAYGRRTRSLHVMLHPERYVRHAPLRAIRALNVAGSLLLAGAAGIVAYDILRAVLGP